MKGGIPTVGFDHQLPSEPASGDAQECFLFAGLGIRSADVGRLKRLLKLAEFEDAGQALAGGHLAVKPKIDCENCRVGVREPLGWHGFIIHFAWSSTTSSNVYSGQCGRPVDAGL